VTPDFPTFDLTGKSALVTGASRGLGRAIATALANAGADVALGLRDPSSGQDVVAEIEAMGRRAFPVPMDATDMLQIADAVDAAEKSLGRIDILVNNVGVAPRNSAEDVTEADFDHTVMVNLKATFFTSQRVGRTMLTRGSGRIIMVGSQAGEVALPTESVYCMTKAAVAHLARCLAVEWGHRGVNVNTVAPTFIETEGTQQALSDEAFRADVEERIAGLHRIGQPMDVAGAVVFLASPAASLITGHTLMVDGGWTVR
jgi:NAD(P)-dependent dehydrogenase (short-subunit alcohol dehydrogenase family)